MTKLSTLTALAEAPDEADELYIRDESEAASAESKKITLANLRLGVLEIANLTELTAGPASGDEFFISDAGTIKRIDVDNMFMPFRGAKAKKSSTETGDYNPTKVIPFPAEDFDTDAFHDASTNNDRLTIPSTFNGYYVEVSALVEASALSSVSNFSYRLFHKNSSDATQNTYQAGGFGWFGSSSAVRMFISSGPVVVSTGDYFYTDLGVNIDNAINISTNSYIAIKILGT